MCCYAFYRKIKKILSALAGKKIYAAGKVRVPRFWHSPLINDKCLSKMGRGTSFEITGTAANQKNEVDLII